jgi:hypothetical protein
MPELCAVSDDRRACALTPATGTFTPAVSTATGALALATGLLSRFAPGVSGATSLQAGGASAAAATAALDE